MVLLLAFRNYVYINYTYYINLIKDIFNFYHLLDCISPISL